MFNNKLTRFSKPVSNSILTRSVVPNSRILSNIKFLQNNLLVNSVYRFRGLIKVFQITKPKKSARVFMNQVKFKFFYKKKKKQRFIKI